MARRPARCLILSQDQVTELAAAIRECVAAWQSQRGATVNGMKLRNIKPAAALLNIAEFVENSYQQQNGAKRYAEAWDSDQDNHLKTRRKLMPQTP